MKDEAYAKSPAGKLLEKVTGRPAEQASPMTKLVAEHCAFRIQSLELDFMAQQRRIDQLVEVNVKHRNRFTTMRRQIEALQKKTKGL